MDPRRGQQQQQHRWGHGGTGEDDDALLNDGDGGGTSGYMEVTPSTWGSGSGSRDAGGYMDVTASRTTQIRSPGTYEDDPDDALIDLPRPPDYSHSYSSAPGAGSHGPPPASRSDFDDDLLQVEDAESVHSRDMPQQPHDVGFSRGIHTPPPVGDGGDDDGLVGYAEMRPDEPRGGDAVAQAAALSPEPPMDRPLTYAGGAVPEDFLRLLVPVEVLIGGPQGAWGQLDMSETTGGQLMIYIAEAKLTKNYGLGRMDPYVRLTSSGCRINSTVCNNGAKHPIWNKQTKLHIDMVLDTHLRVEVLSMGTFSDRLVAWCDIDIEPALLGHKMEDWYKLSGKQGVDAEGVINLVIAFRPFPRPDARAMYSGGSGPPPYPTYGVPPGGGHPPAAVGTGYISGPPPPGRGPHHPHVGYPAQPPAHAGVYPVQRPSPLAQSTGAPTPAQQQQQQQQHREAVTQLRDMFPDLDSETIESVLASTQGNVEAALNALLSMS